MTERASTSRIVVARRRAKAVKLAVVVAAVGAFGTATVLARAAHPGSAGSSVAGAGPVSAAPAEVEPETESNDPFFAPGSVSSAPSTATPQASTRTS